MPGNTNVKTRHETKRNKISFRACSHGDQLKKHLCEIGAFLLHEGVLKNYSVSSPPSFASSSP